MGGNTLSASFVTFVMIVSSHAIPVFTSGNSLPDHSDHLDGRVSSADLSPTPRTYHQRLQY